MRKANIIFLFAVLVLLAGTANNSRAGNEIQVRSPSGTVQFQVLARENRLKFAVTFRHQSVIETSSLHFTVDDVDLAENVEVARTNAYRLKETYPWRGVHAVRDMEARKLTDRATHNVTLPFTRWLAGPAEYTPLHFGDRRQNTTWAHQTASAAILSAPLLTYAAHPAHILANPCCAMIKSIPSTWEETRVLPPSEIGEVAVFARRSGDTWFLAILNNATARKVTIPLSFLGEGQYRAELVRDSQEDAAAVKTQSTTLKRGDSLMIDLREGGGFIARFARK